MTIDIQEAVLTFAQEVQDLLDSVLPRPDDVPPEDRQVQVPFIGGRYSVRVAGDHARVALTKNGARVGYLRVTFQCTSDTAQTYLAVNKSTFELLGFSTREGWPPRSGHPSRANGNVRDHVSRDGTTRLSYSRLPSTACERCRQPRWCRSLANGTACDHGVNSAAVGSAVATVSATAGAAEAVTALLHW